MNKNIRTGGFSLIEVLISVVILASLSIVISQVFITTTQNNTRAQALKEVKQNGDFSISLMERMIRNAKELEVTCTEEGLVTPTVTIKNPDGYSTTFGCTLFNDNGQTYTRLASTSGTQTDYLSTKGLTLGGTDCATSTLTFTCRTVAGSQANITVFFRLGLQSENPENALQSRREFSTTISLRN